MAQKQDDVGEGRKSMAAEKLLRLVCICNSSRSDLSQRAHYPSMLKYPKGVSMSKIEKMEESKALFSVMGMTCSACAASVEKAIKRLPGIQQAIVDVLNNRAQVIFYPSFANVSSFSSSFTSTEVLLYSVYFFCSCNMLTFTLFV